MTSEDYVFGMIHGLDVMSPIEADEPEPEFTIEKFFQDAAVATTIGWDGVEHLRKSTASSVVGRPSFAKTEADEWDEPVGGGAAIAKRFSGKKASRVEKSGNGWTTEYDEKGEILRGYMEEK